MPFLYGASTRLPFIYYVIHLTHHFGLSWLVIGFCVAAYQALRVPPSCLAILAPRSAHFWGCLAGLAGYLVVLFGDNARADVFVAGTAVVGLSETLASMQIYVKTHYSTRKQILEKKIKVQYASVMVGVTFAFGLGGAVYQFYGVDGVAAFGAHLMVLHVASLLAFLAAERSLLWSKAAPSEELPGGAKIIMPPKNNAARFLDDDDDSEKMMNQLRHLSSASATTPPRRSSPPVIGGFEDVLSPRHPCALIDSFAASGLPASGLNYVIALSIGIQAVTIGFNLSIGPIFVQSQFNQPIYTIGTIFSAGGATGTLVAMSLTLTPAGQRLTKKGLPAPYDTYFSMTGVGVAVLVAAIPHFGAHVVGLLLLMAMNDFAAIVLTELQSTICSSRSYRHVGPIGQIIHRSLSAVTAVTGPVLFGAFPRLPYLVAGAVTLLWAVVLYVYVENRRASIGGKFAKSELMALDQAFFLGLPFTSQEILYRVLALTPKAVPEGPVPSPSGHGKPASLPGGMNFV